MQGARNILSFVIFVGVAVIVVHGQQNTCYANCQAGYCLALQPLLCSACDKGLLNLHGNCVGSSLQSPPLTYLKPRLNGLSGDPTVIVIQCNATDSLGLVPLYFSSIVGSTFTREFNLPFHHSYLQIKFNAIVYGTNPFTLTMPNLLINVFQTNRGNIYSINRLLNVQRTVACNNTGRALGVFTINQKISSSATSILLQIRGTDSFNTRIAITALQLYFGRCGLSCSNCTGPTQTQCLTCRGLFNTIQSNNGNSVCVNCPVGFYKDKVCVSCPATCSQCGVVGNVVNCTKCVFEGLSVSNNCAAGYKSYDEQYALNGNIIVDGWISSESNLIITTTCGYYNLIGGISIGKGGSTISKSWRGLVAHTIIYIRFTLFFIDQQSGDFNGVQVTVNGQKTSIQIIIPLANQTYSLTNECGQLNFEYATRLNLSFVHNSDRLDFRVSVVKDYWGLRDFVLLLNNQTNITNCDQQTNGRCVACKYGLALTNNTCNTCPDNYYINQTTAECSICPFYCKTCTFQLITNQFNCLSCYDPFVLDNYYCAGSNNNLFSSQFMSGIPNSIIGNKQWNLYPKLQQQGIDRCGGDIILGTSDIKYKTLTIKRTFTGLPPHTGISLFFHFYQIDDYTNQTVSFFLNNKQIPYNISTQHIQLCGNSTPDAITKIYLRDETHMGGTVTFQVRMDAMGKLGINNVMLAVYGNGDGGFQTRYTMEVMPMYSIDTPPAKGLVAKLSFPNQFQSASHLLQTFKFNLINDQRRLLQSNSSINAINVDVNANRQIYYLLNVSQDLNGQTLQVRMVSASGAYFISDGNIKLTTYNLINALVPSYVEMNTDSIKNRSTIRNLRKLFRGCAILALWMGIFSFFLGMSSAFDDFFLLCQLIFVHTFIQFVYNPPSIRLTFQGLHIVQFMQWLPSKACTDIQNAIIPNGLYQHSPIAYQQYFQDIVFVRTIYHTILFLLAMLILALLLNIIKRALGLDDPQIQQEHKFRSYFFQYYLNYQSRRFVFIDKVMRFAYFTILWACVLQFTYFNNQPQGFHIWNSILCVILFVVAILYPVAGLYYLYKQRNEMHINTFQKRYEDIRIDSTRLFYYLFRYYKLLAIALAIGLSYNTNPMVPSIILIALNLIDVGLLMLLKPLGMVQQQIIDLEMFYYRYKGIYFVTTVLQQLLFVGLEILFLVLYWQRQVQSSTYNGIGYVICVFVILLLLNGLFRLFWGFMKILQHGYISHQSNLQSIDKQIQQNKQLGDQVHPIADELNRSPMITNRKDTMIKEMLNSKRLSMVSRVGN